MKIDLPSIPPHILDVAVDAQKLCRKDQILLAGSSILAVFYPDIQPNDIDIFFLSTSMLKLTEKFCANFGQHNPRVNDPNYPGNGSTSYYTKDKKLNYIFARNSTAQKILSDFDFSILQCGFLYPSMQFICNNQFLVDRDARVLRCIEHQDETISVMDWEEPETIIKTIPNPRYEHHQNRIAKYKARFPDWTFVDCRGPTFLQDNWIIV